MTGDIIDLFDEVLVWECPKCANANWQIEIVDIQKKIMRIVCSDECQGCGFAVLVKVEDIHARPIPTETDME